MFNIDMVLSGMERARQVHELSFNQLHPGRKIKVTKMNGCPCDKDGEVHFISGEYVLLKMENTQGIEFYQPQMDSGCIRINNR